MGHPAAVSSSSSSRTRTENDIADAGPEEQRHFEFRSIATQALRGPQVVAATLNCPSKHRFRSPRLLPPPPTSRLAPTPTHRALKMHETGWRGYATVRAGANMFFLYRWDAATRAVAAALYLCLKPGHTGPERIPLRRRDVSSFRRRRISAAQPSSCSSAWPSPLELSRRKRPADVDVLVARSTQIVPALIMTRRPGKQQTVLQKKRKRMRCSGAREFDQDNETRRQ